MSSVYDIISTFLDAEGYDGLYSDEECACTADDISPANCLTENCMPGVYISKEQANLDDEYDFYIGARGKENEQNI